MGIHQERNKEMKYDGMPVRAVISMLINVCIVSYMITNYCCADIIRLYVSCNIIHCNISTPLYFVLCAIVKRPIVDFRIFQFSKLGWEQISIINNDWKQFSINQITWNHLQINTGTCKWNHKSCLNIIYPSSYIQALTSFNPTPAGLLSYQLL